MDIGPYWFKPLGRAFGVTEAAVERRARVTLRGALRWTATDWRADGERLVECSAIARPATRMVAYRVRMISEPTMAITP